MSCPKPRSIRTIKGEQNPQTVKELKNLQRGACKDNPSQSLRKGLKFTALGLLVNVSIASPFGEYLESNLTLHLLAEHHLLIIGGFLLAYGLGTVMWSVSSLRGSKIFGKIRSSFFRANSVLNRSGLFTFAIAVLLAIYWHLPDNFNAPVLNEGVHINMHLSFITIGILILIGSMQLSRSMRLLFLLLGEQMMIPLGAYLISGNPYPVYSRLEQAEAGFMALATMGLIEMAIFSYWIYRYW